MLKKTKEKMKKIEEECLPLEQSEQEVTVDEEKKENESCKINNDTKHNWNVNLDGIATKFQVRNFINYLCEYDLLYAFNNKFDGHEKVFGTAVVESINFYLQCAALMRSHDPEVAEKIVNMKPLQYIQSTLGT